MNFMSHLFIVFMSNICTAISYLKSEQQDIPLNTTLNDKGCGESMASRLVHDVAMEKIVVAQNPWLVLLAIRTDDSIGTCSGTIVTRIHVLTNAQCLIRQRTGPRSVTVFYSSYEKFHGYRVESPFIESRYARTVCIPVERFDTEGLLLIVAGWGQKDNTTRPQRTMYNTVVMVLPSGECERRYKQFGFEETIMFCAIRVEARYCESDTGGPAVAATTSGRFYLVGLLSYATSCANMGSLIYPSIFTRIDAFTSWIGSSISSARNYKTLLE
ncbi:hypothetical protein MTO96_048692 [Rhipicephalus appendiculatus]